MRLPVSIFLHGFLLAALLSVASEWFPVSLLHAIVAWTVFSLGLVLYLFTAFLPQLPKRFILPAFLFLVWTNICGGFPLAFVFPDHFQSALDWSQLILAIGLSVMHLKWFRTPPKLEAESFSWPAFALIAVLTALAVPFVLTAAAINMAGVYLESTSGGYVKLRPEGILLEEREMTKGNKHVRLVSMVHIGEKSFYDSILASIHTSGTAVVLLEGVTDDKELLKSKFSYSKIAHMLGLDAQEGSSFHKIGKSGSKQSDSEKGPRPDVEYRRADVDISMFQPLTLEFMNAMGTILSDPTAETIRQTMQDPNSPFKQPDADKIVMRDILDKRNVHLISEIDHALETSQTVIVPWGALHLSFIEASLRAEGFQETSHVSRPIIHFWHQKTSTPAR